MALFRPPNFNILKITKTIYYATLIKAIEYI